jgi:hypothetical protein
VQGGDAGRVRLELAQPRGVDPPQAGHAVGLAAPLELVQAGELALVQRDDHLAAALVRDPALLAVARQLAHALDAQARLQRPRRVVDAGVDDAGVVTRLVGGELRLALQHDDAAPRIAARELARDGKAEDPSADHRDAGFGHGRERSHPLASKGR